MLESTTAATGERCPSGGAGDLQEMQHCMIPGAQKAGTTALQAWLARRPLVAPSNPKELHADPDAAAVQLGEFLGLAPTPLLGGLPSENRAVGLLAAAIQRAGTPPFGKAARALLPLSLRRAVKGAVAKGDSKPPIDDETADLLAEFYREPDAALAELLGRDLPW